MEPILRSRLVKSFLAFCLALVFTLTWGIRLSVATDATPEQLIEQATASYNASQYQQAKQLWRQAATTAKSDGQRAVAWGNLALTLQQLGEWGAADRAINQGLELTKSQQNLTQAQLLDIQGNLAFDRGRFQNALDIWQQAGGIYQTKKDTEGAYINQLNQVQALQMLGRFTPAQRLLDQLKLASANQSNPLLKVRELRSWLELSAKLGHFDRPEQAATVLTEAEPLLKQLPIAQQQQEKGAMLLSLGNISRSFAEREREVSGGSNPSLAKGAKACRKYDGPSRAIAEQALNNYQQAAQLMRTNPAMALQSQLSELSLTKEMGNTDGSLVAAIETTLSRLPANRSSIFAAINLSQSLLCESEQNDDNIAKHLSRAVAQAQEIQDKRAESYALGTLGKLYERQGLQLTQAPLRQKQLTYAKQLSEKALTIAGQIDAADITYQWQWQMGRILRELGGEPNRQQALSNYYPQAVKSLEKVRGQLIGTNSDVQFSFRDSAEPVYREYVDLLLDEPNPSPQRLNQAIELIDSLQVAELENFFRCVLSQFVQISQVSQKNDPEAAIFYPIILPDRLEVIVQLPNQAAPKRYVQMIPNADQEIEKTVFALRDAFLTENSYASEYQEPGQKIYQWLIQAAEADLAKAKIKTLVFVLDGELRNIPIGALWDGQGFVVQKYAVAVTPGLNLLGPKRFEAQQFKALLGGLTGQNESNIVASSRQTFGALEHVQTEIDQLKTVIPGSTVLVDNQFVPEKLAANLKQNSYPIVHLATHGIFSNNPKDTYLVTAENQYLDIDRLQELLRAGKGNRQDALELLTLSACQTAKGNRRATLGMAGVAIRAGASSTMATLWSVNDQSTGKLVAEFYRNLRGAIEKRDGTTKAQALRQAQLALLENAPAQNPDATPDYSHPYYWAPFILLGNWL